MTDSPHWTQYLEWYNRNPNTYHMLRVDLDTVTRKEVQEIIVPKVQFWVYGKESKADLTNPHIHYVVPFTCTTQHVRKCLREKGITGNGKYSIKKVFDTPLDLATAVAYTIKDRKYKTSDNFPPDLLEVALFISNTVKASKTKKTDKKTQLETLKEKIQSLPPDEQICTMNMLIRFIIKHFKEESKLIREFQLISLVQTLALHLNIKVDHNGKKVAYEEFFYEKLMSKVL